MPGLTDEAIKQIATYMTRAWWPPTRWFPMSYSSAASAAGVDAGAYGESQFVAAASAALKRGAITGAERAATLGAIESVAGADAAAAAGGITLASEGAEAATITILGTEMTVGAAIAAGLVIAVVVVGAVVIIKKASSSGSSRPAAITQTDNGGGEPPPSGDVDARGTLQTSAFGKALASQNFSTNTVEVAFPAGGGSVASQSGAHVTIKDFPFGAFLYSLGAGTAGTLGCGLFGTDCADTDIPEPYKSCKADFDVNITLAGSYDAGAKSLSGNGTAAIKADNTTSSCPAGAPKLGTTKPITWRATYSGNQVNGAISLDQDTALPFTAVAQ